MAMESRVAKVQSRTELLSDSAFSLAAVDADRAPMPTAAIDANREIMNHAGAMTSEAMRSSQVGLGNVVGGNNAVMMPPAQQINGSNGALLALAGAAIGVGAYSALSGSSSPKKAEPNQGSRSASNPPTPSASPSSEASTPEHQFQTISVTDSSGNTMWQGEDPNPKTEFKTISVTDDSGNTTWQGEDPGLKTDVAAGLSSQEPMRKQQPADYELKVEDTNKNGHIDGDDRVTVMPRDTPGDGEITTTVRDFVEGKQFGKEFGTSDERWARIQGVRV